MHKVKTNQHWAAYLAASERRAASRRRHAEITDMTGSGRLAFWLYAGGTTVIIGWLLVFGWQ